MRVYYFKVGESICVKKTNGFEVLRDGICLQFVFQVRQVHPLGSTQFFSSKKTFLEHFFRAI
jgi:hypothetical protein